MKTMHWMAAAMAAGTLGLGAGAQAQVQAASGSGPPAPVHCPRACMTQVMDQYLDALVRHDPSGLPLSKGVRFTENTEEIHIGEGLWIGASEGPTTFKIYAVDPASSQVVFDGVMKERGRPIQIAVRLKLVNGRITEIEHVINRSISAGAAPNTITPRAALVTDVPAAERTPRDMMINAADDYFEAIEHNDGSRAPFAPDCDRRENGSKTTNNHPPVAWPVPLGSPEADRGMALMGSMGCAEQLNTGVMAFITRLWPRRIAVVDEERGLVVAFPMFNQRANPEGKVHLRNVPGVDTLNLGSNSSNLQATEVFKIRAGRIHEIEAMGVNLPYGAKSGWEQYGQ